MPPLLLLAWRNSASRPLRTALTVLAVTLGVAMLVAVAAANATIDASLEVAARRLVGRADVEVRSFGDRGFTQETTAQLVAMPEVLVASPSVRKRVFYRHHAHEGFVELIGLDPAGARALGDFALREGAFLPDESVRSVMVLAGWAQARGVRAGDYLELMSLQGLLPFQVVGLLDDAGLGETGYGQLVYVSLQAAQSLFNLGDRVERVGLQLRPGAEPAALEAHLQAVLAQDYLVVPAAERARGLRDSVLALQRSLSLFGVLPLLVGAFFVLSSFLLSIAERVRELALLRVAGATPGQVFRLTLAEALLLGIGGSLAGTVLGVGLAAGLVRALEASGDLRLLAWRLPTETLLLAPLVGLIATLLAAVPAARQAARVPPLEALRPARALSAAPVSRPVLRWSLAGLVAAAALLATAYLVPGARPLALAALLILFPSVIVLAPALLVGVNRALAPVVRCLPAVGRLGARNLERNRARSAVTLAALIVGFALTVGVWGLSASASRVGRDRAEALFAAQHAVVSPVAQPAAIAADFAMLPGVVRVSPVRRFQALRGREIVDVVALEPAVYASQPAEGGRDDTWRQALQRLVAQPSGAVITPALAAAWGVGVGSVVEVRGADRGVALPIAAVAESVFPSDDDRGALVITWPTYRSWLGTDDWQYLNVLLADPGDARALGTLDQAAALYGVQVVSTAQIADSIQRSLTRVLGLVNAMLALGVVIAALSVLNTMLLNVYDRLREIGLLRASGMPPRDAALMILFEAASLGLLAAAVGGGLGLALGAIVLRLAQSPELPAPYVFPLGALIASALVAAVLVPTACLPPAIRAARVNIVDALAHKR